MGRPESKRSAAAATQHLGDKLQTLAQESPRDLFDLEKLVDWKLARLRQVPTVPKLKKPPPPRL